MIRHQRLALRSVAGLAGLLLLAAGCSSNDNTQAPIIPPPDDAPPLAPLGMTAGKSSEVAFSVSWAPNSEPDLVGYRVYVDYPHTNSETAYRLVNPSGLITKNRYSSQVEVGADGSTPTEVFLRVSAVDAGGNESSLSPVCRIPLSASSVPTTQDPNADDDGGNGGNGGGRGGTTGQGPGKEPSNDDMPDR